MVCPRCGSKVVVLDNVKTPDNEVYRRKECTICGHRFYTVEFEVEDDKTLRDIWYKSHRDRSLHPRKYRK